MSGESVRQRASVEFKKWIAKQPEQWKALELTEFWIGFATAESSLARKQEREAIAKMYCSECRNTEDLEPAEFIDGKWRHKVKAGHGAGYFSCDAGPIHERGRKVEG